MDIIKKIDKLLKEDSAAVVEDKLFGATDFLTNYMRKSGQIIWRRF